MTKKTNKTVEQFVEVPTVMCVVLEKFKDKTIGDVRRKGDVIMVTEERFAELTQSKKWVAKVEQSVASEPAEPVEDKKDGE